MLRYFKNKRRKKIQSIPLSNHRRQILIDHLPLYRRLPPSDQNELENTLKVLIDEKLFIGTNGLEVTEEMRVLICGQASLLLLHRKSDFFPNVNTIVIYPQAFVSNIKEYLGGGAYLEKPSARIGESSSQSEVIVLAWDSARAGLSNNCDGRNVILHEFAHQLDSEDGSTDGAPLLASASAYRAWSLVMSEEFERLHQDISHHRETFIDEYGATSPAEFFAVLTESFFEKPSGLKNFHPEIYQLLVDFYRQDPVELAKEG